MPEAAANVKTQNTHETKSAAAVSGEKVERKFAPQDGGHGFKLDFRAQENNRSKEISAIRKLFGDESLLSKTA
jgi:hypothetical protein